MRLVRIVDENLTVTRTMLSGRYGLRRCTTVPSALRMKALDRMTTGKRPPVMISRRESHEHRNDTSTRVCVSIIPISDRHSETIDGKTISKVSHLNNHTGCSSGKEIEQRPFERDSPVWSIFHKLQSPSGPPIPIGQRRDSSS
jgi:hypothetical protein